jgi:transglutaminase-like putative cysteine protease
MDLGSLDPLLDSNTIVFRVRGPRVDYLRGAALDIYEAGRWIRSDEAEHETKLDLGGQLRFGEPVEITTLSERADRFFAPLSAGFMVTSPSSVLIDRLGAIKRTHRGAGVLRFVPGSRERAVPNPPWNFDLQVPRRIRPQLTNLAGEWTQGKTSISEKLDAIELRLQRDYRYARGVRRVRRVDPALEFLLLNQQGSCEHFATAMALVARASGIPTRVITGYRVGEKSPFGYYVVRERNAHSWVEAWIPGAGWVTRDATPEAFLPQNREHEASYAASLVDAISVYYDTVTNWLERLTVEQTAIGWVLGSVILAWIVARGARRRRTEKRRVAEDEAALPILHTLLKTLARAGHTRNATEPIEQLAARVPDARATDLLVRYAAFRYGDRGDAEELAKDISAYARRAVEEPAERTAE